MEEENTRYKDRIAQDPRVMVGKPVIRGTRIPVELILDWLSGSLDVDEFFEAYPRLTVEDVQAALAFARDSVRAEYLRSQERKDALAAAEAWSTPVTAKTSDSFSMRTSMCG